MAECRKLFLARQLSIIEEWREDWSTEQASNMHSSWTVASIRDFLVTSTEFRLGVNAGAIDPDQSMGRQNIDSLAAISLASAVKSRFGVALPVSSFYGEESFSAIAARVHSEISQQAHSTSLLSIEPEINGVLSHEQRSRWLLDQMSTSECELNVVVRAARVVGNLDADALRRSLEQLVNRHPMLRTTFSSLGDELEQIVHSQLVPEFVEYDTCDISDEYFTEQLEKEAWRPFSLESGPLLRVQVFRRDQGEDLLLFATHHILIDFWSLEILFTEWAALYTKELGDSSAHLLPLDFTYTEHVRRQTLSFSVEGERLCQYWESQLAGDLPRVTLPHDRLPPVPRTHQGAAITFTFDESLTRRIKSFAEVECVTPYTVVLAALNLLLYQYTGQDDVIVGTPMASRAPQELSGVVGCFINPVAIRTDLSGDPPFRELLARLRESIMDAIEHRAYPFEAIVDRLSPKRFWGQSPLFDILFVWLEAHQSTDIGLVSFALEKEGARLDFGGVTLESVPLRSQTTLFDLELMVGIVGAELQGKLTYSTDLFEASTAGRIVEHLHNLLDNIVNTPVERISRLSLLSKAEEHWLSACYESAEKIPDLLLHELFTERAASDPAVIAISFQDEEITYGELDAKSSRLAQWLLDAGAAGQPIAIGLADGPEPVIAMLAVLKVGSAFVCVDVTESPDRLQRILVDVEPSHLVLNTSLLGSIHHLDPLASYEVVLVEDVLSGHWVASMPQPACNVPASSAAYIVYTSGSSGEPKGIVQSHASFCQFLQWQIKRFDMGPPQRIAQWAALTYDAAYCEIFGALCAGSTLCMATISTRRDPTALLTWVKQEAITLLQVVPSFCQQLLNRIAALPSLEEDPLQSVEWMLLSGEVFPVELARELLARYPVCPAFFNLYGPSESVLATCYSVVSIPENARSIPIGRPFDGRQIFVLDKHYQLCPKGVIGEIYIRSRTLTTGYLRRPKETASAYLSALQAEDSEDKMYRTGDLGRWLESGDLEFCGRRDEQIKIRGVRIELGEVESILRLHASLEDCVVILRDDGQGSHQVIAYLVSREPVSIGALRKSAKAALPAQAVPAAFVQLKALPRTRTGKIARRLLPAPTNADFTNFDAQTATSARSQTEELVADVWCELLGITVIGEQSFFELGGHSLTAMQARNLLRQRTGIELSLTSLFEKPTVSGIAAFIDARNCSVEKEIEQIVTEIEGLSDNQVASLLRTLP